jgi:chromosome segregation ATPase
VALAGKDAELVKAQAQLVAAQQAQGQVVAGKEAELVKERQELVKAQAALQAAQRAHGVALAGKDAELVKAQAQLVAAQQAQGQVVAGKEAELVKAQAQLVAEKTRLEQVIERLKATVERLTNRLLGLEEKLGALKATPAPVQVPAALAEDTKLALVEKYKSVGRGVAPGAIEPSWLEDAVLVEQQNGIAVYRHGSVHFIQPALEQTELERQGIQKGGVGR